MTKERLKDFYSRYQPILPKQVIQQIYQFQKHPLLESCFASLIPYFDLKENLPFQIASIKIEEAISILRSTNKAVDGLLADFEEPGKIDLAEYMERHFMFNMPMEKFSYLTGRSLATFRRDFKRAYKITPQKWLTEKRLKLAHYLIAEKRVRPIDGVCRGWI